MNFKTGFAPLDNMIKNLGRVWRDVGRLIQEVFQGDFSGALEVGKRLLGNLVDYAHFGGYPDTANPDPRAIQRYRLGRAMGRPAQSAASTVFSTAWWPRRDRPYGVVECVHGYRLERYLGYPHYDRIRARR
jgi:hypothetical protein